MLVHACARGLSIRVYLCNYWTVFSRTLAVVDTKRGYVGRYNKRSAQQESGAALLMFPGGLINII